MPCTPTGLHTATKPSSTWTVQPCGSRSALPLAYSQNAYNSWNDSSRLLTSTLTVTCNSSQIFAKYIAMLQSISKSSVPRSICPRSCPHFSPPSLMASYTQPTTKHTVQTHFSPIELLSWQLLDSFPAPLQLNYLLPAPSGPPGLLRSRCGTAP